MTGTRPAGDGTARQVVRRLTGRGRFVPALVAVAAVGVVVRLLFGFVLPDDHRASDVDWYRNMASNVADGHGLSLDLPVMDADGIERVPEVPTPTAKHPPFHPTVLAVGDAVGLSSFGSQQVLLSLVGGAGIVLLGLAGRSLVGARVGLVAAAVSAVHPLWFQPAGLLTSEATYLPLLAGVVWAFARLRSEPSMGRALGLGAFAAAIALTRAEGALLTPLIALAVVAVGADRAPWRERLRLAAVVVLVAGLVTGAWVVRNRQQVGATQVSTNGGVTLAGANCDETYAGKSLGSFSLRCAIGTGTEALLAHQGVPQSEGAVDGWVRELGVDYVKGHKRRVPTVVLARVARTGGLWSIGDQLRFDVNEGRHEPSQRVGLVLHLVLLPAAIAGAVILVRRRSWEPLAIGAALVLVAAATGAAIYGSTRMRATAEPALALFAAVALVALGEWIVGRRARTTTD